MKSQMTRVGEMTSRELYTLLTGLNLNFLVHGQDQRGEPVPVVGPHPKPVEQLLTFQAINVITRMLKSNFGKFRPELLRVHRDSFRWDFAF